MRAAANFPLLTAVLLLAGPAGPWATTARAEEGPLVRADALFEQGKARMAADDLERGCADLAESFRLEPATGSLLALALCHEKQGKNLSALVEYREVLARSVREGRADRARAAQLKVLTLESKIPSIRIDVPPDRKVDGLTVRLNGVELRADQLGTAIPVDGPRAQVEATAARHQAWRSTFPVAEEHQVIALMLPVLEQLPGSIAGAPAPVPARREASAKRDPQRAGKIASLAAAGIGLGSLIASGALTIRAVKLDDRSASECDGNLCTQEGKDLRLDARSAGSAATITGAAGIALAGAGIATYFVLSRRGRRGERSPHVQAAPFVFRESAGAVIRGHF
jgi:hypothetical protein